MKIREYKKKKENIRSFFRAGAFKKKYKNFFRGTFWRLRPKSALGSPIIYYLNLIREKDATYPFMIVNTDKCGTHCLRVLVSRG